ncbi:MAG: Gfo/Idh/MocA family oxidoreductase [Thermoguttaceae bacterium]
MLKSKQRRTFLKQSGAIAAGVMLAGNAATPRVHAAENNTIKIAIVGCGSRGRGALMQALNADPNVKLWATADAFPDRADAAVELATDNFPDKVDVGDRKFAGLDAYKNAIDSLGPQDVVLLTTPPAFRPLHFDYAVKKGVNIFAEKPLATDIPGVKWILESNKIAKEKGLRVGVGLNNRHYFRTEETINAIHDGKLGEITSMWVYRMHPPHRLGPIGDMTPLQHQLKNIFCFNWTSGGFIVDALIHNLDICCWAKGELPIAAQGQGGRVIRKFKDDLIDQAAVEYIFADGRKLMMQTRTIDNTWSCFQSIMQGTKGCVVVGEGVGSPKIYSDCNCQNPIWTAEAQGNDSYQSEHDLFFAAMRRGDEWNEIQNGANATFVALFGRMAADTGQYITADQAWNSTFQFAPNIGQLTIDGPSPVMPDVNGDYSIPMPGITTI